MPAVGLSFDLDAIAELALSANRLRIALAKGRLWEGAIAHFARAGMAPLSDKGAGCSCHRRIPTSSSWRSSR
jgi:hypothetical protein